jgi:hypothetical protein
VTVRVRFGFVNMRFGFVERFGGLFGGCRLDVIASLLSGFRDRFSGLLCGGDRLRERGYGEGGGQNRSQKHRGFHELLPLVFEITLIRKQYKRFR